MHPDNMPQGCSITSTTTTSSGDHLQGPRNVRITSISLLFHTLQVRERLFCSSGPTHTVASQVMESFYMCFHPVNQSDVCKGHLQAFNHPGIGTCSSLFRGRYLLAAEPVQIRKGPRTRWHPGTDAYTLCSGASFSAMELFSVKIKPKNNKKHSVSPTFTVTTLFRMN